MRLPENDTAQIVADACALWTKGTLTPNPAASAGAEGCEGADGGIVFAAHIEREPNEEDTQLTIQLDAANPAF